MKQSMGYRLAAKLPRLTYVLHQRLDENVAKSRFLYWILICSSAFLVSGRLVHVDSVWLTGYTRSGRCRFLASLVAYRRTAQGSDFKENG